SCQTAKSTRMNPAVMHSSPKPRIVARTGPSFSRSLVRRTSRRRGGGASSDIGLLPRHRSAGGTCRGDTDSPASLAPLARRPLSDFRPDARTQVESMVRESILLRSMDVPESKVRKKAAYSGRSGSAVKKPNSRWFLPAMLTVLLLGLAWVVTFY